jgi:phage FluMu protein Com
MTTTNPITGDPIQTKPASDNYRDNFDRVFRKPCPRCGKVNAADIHTCTPLEIMEAQQQLTDLCQDEDNARR